jgi:hypothetical protein
MAMTREEAIARMTALAARQPLSALCEALTALDAKAKPSPAERLARAVLIDVICKRCPAADAAFNAWAEAEDTGNRTAVQVITAAAKAA